MTCLTGGGRERLSSPAMQQTETETQQWFALRVYRNRTAPIREQCDKDGVQYYIPMRLAERPGHDGPEYGEEPLIASLMFLRATEEYVGRLRRSSCNRVLPYCHPGTMQPAPIEERAMEMFMFVVKAGAGRAESVELSMLKGDRVRVTGGHFKGAEGYIMRIHGTRRFVVAVEGVAAVAVTHVPRQFLEKAGPCTP